MGIIPSRGFQLCAFDFTCDVNPYKSDSSMLGAVSTFAATQIAITAGVNISYSFNTLAAEVSDLFHGLLECFANIPFCLHFVVYSSGLVT